MTVIKLHQWKVLECSCVVTKVHFHVAASSFHQTVVKKIKTKQEELKMKYKNIPQTCNLKIKGSCLWLTETAFCPRKGTTNVCHRYIQLHWKILKKSVIVNHWWQKSLNHWPKVLWYSSLTDFTCLWPGSSYEAQNMSKPEL